MSQYTFLRILLSSCLILCVTCTISLGQDRDRSERFFGYLDKDKNGRLDEDEVRRMPGSIREAFQKADFSLDRGISKDDFVREMPRIMEDMRRRREEDRDKGRDDDRRREEPRREESRRDDDRNRSKGYSYSPRKRPKITMDIPSKFEDGDTDADGQIGLYEWRQWKPQEKYHFPVYDINRDGFLTPRELSNPPSKEEIDNYLASIGAPAQTAQPRPSGSSGETRPSATPVARAATEYRTESSGNTPAKVAETKQETDGQDDNKDATSKTAKLFFQQMDADKSGSLTPDEWARSRRLKPKFEEVGIDLSKPMDLDEFTAGYRKAYGET